MMDIFRKDFNYYKQKDSSLQDVLNFNDFSCIKDKVEKIEVCTNCESMFGLKHPREWEIYRLISNSGFIFIKNPFTSVGQRYWIMRCLKDYPRTPSKTNLDAQSVIAKDADWPPFNDSNGNDLLLNKLRWVTLGYHHNWDTKVYSEDSKSDFPADLQLLSQYIAKVLEFESFTAEAAIVNFYHMNSRLSGHTDHSEQCLESPLFSFSFGQTAIFLLGGITVDVKPAAMFLNSGDIVVMSKESRLSYHGVPKIIRSYSTPWCNEIPCNTADKCEPFDNAIVSCQDSCWTPFEVYINVNRININVRQVLKTNRERVAS